MFAEDDFRFIRTSFDGGVALECWRNYDLGEAQLVVSAIWQDESQGFTIKTEATVLPFSVWESFIAEARQWCPTPKPRP